MFLIFYFFKSRITLCVELEGGLCYFKSFMLLKIFRSNSKFKQPRATEGLSANIWKWAVTHRQHKHWMPRQDDEWETGQWEMVQLRNIWRESRTMIYRVVCAQHQHCLGGVINAEPVAHLGSTESESAFNHIPRWLF